MAKDFEGGPIRKVGGGTTVVEMNFVILDNDTISQEAVDLGGYSLVAIYMPAGWDAADLEFLAAYNDEDPETPEDVANPDLNVQFGDYHEVFDSSGAQVALTVAIDRVVVPTPDVMAALAALRFVRLQSSAAQTSDRQLFLILKS